MNAEPSSDDTRLNFIDRNRRRHPTFGDFLESLTPNFAPLLDRLPLDGDLVGGDLRGELPLDVSPELLRRVLGQADVVRTGGGIDGDVTDDWKTTEEVVDQRLVLDGKLTDEST